MYSEEIDVTFTIPTNDMDKIAKVFSFLKENGINFQVPTDAHRLIQNDNREIYERLIMCAVDDNHELSKALPSGDLKEFLDAEETYSPLIDKICTSIESYVESHISDGKIEFCDQSENEIYFTCDYDSEEELVLKESGEEICKWKVHGYMFRDYIEPCFMIEISVDLSGTDLFCVHHSLKKRLTSN